MSLTTYLNETLVLGGGIIIKNWYIIVFNCFSYRNAFPNGVNVSLSQILVFKNSFLSKKLKILCSLDLTILFNLTSMWYKHFERNIWRDFSLPAFKLATAARKSSNGKFTAKIDFLIRHFIVTIADAHIESLKSLHTLFDKNLHHMLVKIHQSRMGWIIQNFEIFDKKCLTILEDLSVLETFVFC